VTGLEKRKIPLLKEYHIEKIVSSLECIKDHPYRREQQRDCILSLYPGKTEKSVFRGMIIPTLRKMGLILGYDNFIRISANGSIAVESKNLSANLHQRALRALILETDRKKFGFIMELSDFALLKKVVEEKQFKMMLTSKIISPSSRQGLERITHWLEMLKQVGLVKKEMDEIAIDQQEYELGVADLNVTDAKLTGFRECLIGSIIELRREAGIVVDIADLRERVAIKLLNKNKEILTEDQFDELLREVLITTTNKYAISLGRPMGAEEKLFSFKGKHYRTLTIELEGRK
jgi:hypothetical protein